MLLDDNTLSTSSICSGAVTDKKLFDLFSARNFLNDAYDKPTEVIPIIRSIDGPKTFPSIMRAKAQINRGTPIKKVIIELIIEYFIFYHLEKV